MGIPAAPTRPTSVRTLTVALVGNPNTGKSTLFNALAGMRQRVGNYPGVTVETKKGQMRLTERVFELIDLPGTYSLAPRSPDEMLAVDLLLGRRKEEPRPDVVISIVDASNLERNLYLTTQVLELGVRVVIALNMIDLAAHQGIRIDAERLAQQIGVPVVPIQANKGKGLDRLKAAIAEAADSPLPAKHVAFPQVFDQEVAALQQALGADTPLYLARRLLLDVGSYAETLLAARDGLNLAELVHASRRRLGEARCPVPAVEPRTRYQWIREVTDGCVTRPLTRPLTWTDRLDKLLTHRVWGTLIFLAVMFLVFESIFTWARPVMRVIGAGKDMLADAGRAVLPSGILSSLILDGVLEGVGSVVVFLPQIVILFGFIAILEDCGYMARAAFLMDKLMARCGLSGKSFIPMLSSVACAVPGIMATRVIEDRRDRLATILVAPLMSCSARLPVYILLIGAFLTEGFPWWLPGLVMFSMYAIGLVAAPLVAFCLKATLLRGSLPPFVMEMPLYKWPSWRTVGRRMYDSGWEFTRRAGTLILASMVVVWALLYFPRGTYPEQIATLEREHAALTQQLADAPEQQREELAANQSTLDSLHGEWRRQSILGRTGRAVEPVVRPLGWDWRIAMAALASFPAREVVVGTLGIIYNEGKVESDEIRDADRPSEIPLARTLQEARWEDRPDEKVFTIPTALSLMVFFALCCQCASTLAVIRRETRSWKWPAFTFAYMTALAYLGSLIVYQVGKLFLV
jgi:ferrous iron transport protein B